MSTNKFVKGLFQSKLLYRGKVTNAKGTKQGSQSALKFLVRSKVGKPLKTLDVMPHGKEESRPATHLVLSCLLSATLWLTDATTSSPELSQALDGHCWQRATMVKHIFFSILGKTLEEEYQMSSSF